MVEIRVATNADAAQLHRLNILFNGEGCNTMEGITESLQQNGQEIVYVAALGAKLVGFCCGQAMQSLCYAHKYGEITELFVLGEYRRQGIGKRLLRAAEAALAARGARHLHILTGKDNAVAQALYRACGFADTSEVLLDKDLD